MAEFTAIVIRRATATAPATMEKVTLPEKNWFKAVQTLCGGYIQLFHSYKGERTKRGGQASLDVWCNEDGISQFPFPTIRATQPYETHLFGPIVIMAAKKAYGNVREMTQAEQESIALLHTPGFLTDLRMLPL
jgi:hypothetical protein